MTDLPPSRSVFVERPAYRRRRMMDAARLLPILGISLLMVPLLWQKPDATGQPGDMVKMSDAIFYVFGVWALMISLAALFGLRARSWSDTDRPRATGSDDTQVPETE